MNHPFSYWTGIGFDNSINCSPGFYLQNPAQIILSLSQQLRNSGQEAQALRSKLSESELKNQVLVEENEKLKQELHKKTHPVRRKYRKRRTGEGMKLFHCGVHQCNNRYSSRIALNAHIRKKHSQVSLPIRRHKRKL